MLTEEVSVDVYDVDVDTADALCTDLALGLPIDVSRETFASGHACDAQAGLSVDPLPPGVYTFAVVATDVDGVAIAAGCAAAALDEASVVHVDLATTDAFDASQLDPACTSAADRCATADAPDSCDLRSTS